MTNKLQRNILLSLAFGALVYIAFAIYADAGNLAAAFSRFRWWFLPLILACSSANYALRFAKWDLYTRVLGMRPTTGQNIVIFFAAFTMAVTPGKLGEVIKSYTLRSVNGTPVVRSAPVILAERLTDFIGLILLIVAGAYGFGFARGAIIAFALFFAGVTILLAWRRGSEGLIRLFDRVPLLRRFTGHARSAYESMHALLRPAPLAGAVALSVVAWFFECLGYWIVLDVFGASVTLLQAMFIYSFSTIVGAVTMLPGGLGSTETSLTGLAQLRPMHVEKSIAVASTFIIRAATLWFAVLVGVAVTFLFQKKLSISIADLPLDAETPPEAPGAER